MLRYYLLTLSGGYARPPVVENWYGKLSRRDITPERAYLLANRTVLPIRPNPKTVFTDLLLSPFFLVSAQFKSVMELYEPRMIMKEVILMDSKNGLVALYFLPVMEKTACLSPESVLSPDKSVLKKAVIDHTKTNGRAILLLDGVGTTNLLVRLDFAESLLRRGLDGVMLTPVELV